MRLKEKTEYDIKLKHDIVLIDFHHKDYYYTIPASAIFPLTIKHIKEYQYSEIVLGDSLIDIVVAHGFNIYNFRTYALVLSDLTSDVSITDVVYKYFG